MNSNTRKLAMHILQTPDAIGWAAQNQGTSRQIFGGAAIFPWERCLD
jgi:hypothetical protein